jgi:Ser/Thr protein kinase RdoA (MazF antagonist)
LALRISLPDRRTRAEVGVETRWLDALTRETDVSVPAPLAARDGSFVVDVDADDVAGWRMCVVFRWLKGRPLTEDLTERNLAAAGEVVARLHSHAGTFRAPEGLRTWDSPFPFGTPVVLFDAGYRSILPSPARALMEQAREAAQRAIERLQAAEPPRVLHADLHDENLFVDGGVVRVLDFDDSLIGWPVQDLGITWFALAGRDDFRSLAATFREGYERAATWPERGPDEVATFAAARALDLANYQVQDHDPRYQAEAPQAIERYAAKIDRLLNGAS